MAQPNYERLLNIIAEKGEDKGAGVECHDVRLHLAIIYAFT